MKKRLDLIGRKFGKLLVITLVTTTKGKRKWACECDCGKVCIREQSSLMKGASKSCGCNLIEAARNQKKIRNPNAMSRKPEYHVWRGMKYRCINPNHISFDDYGGRGIKVCDRWMNSFENFLEDMGCRPSKKHSLNRIDNNGNYEPSNCEWTTMSVQVNNRRNTTKVVFDGIEMPLSRAAEIAGMSQAAAKHRVKMGIPLDIDFNRRNLTVEHKGKKVPLAEACKDLGIHYHTGLYRINNGHKFDESMR